jgi:hypothetical protein
LTVPQGRRDVDTRGRRERIEGGIEEERVAFWFTR